MARDGTSLPIATPKTPGARLDALIRSGGAPQPGCRRTPASEAAAWSPATGPHDGAVPAVAMPAGRMGGKATGVPAAWSRAEALPLDCPAVGQPSRWPRRVRSCDLIRCGEWDMAAAGHRHQLARPFLGCPGGRRPRRGACASRGRPARAAHRAGRNNASGRLGWSRQAGQHAWSLAALGRHWRHVPVVGAAGYRFRARFGATSGRSRSTLPAYPPASRHIAVDRPLRWVVRWVKNRRHR